MQVNGVSIIYLNKAELGGRFNITEVFQCNGDCCKKISSVLCNQQNELAEQAGGGGA